MERMLRYIAFAVALMLTTAAQADLVAGWDFSQFRSTGLPTIDGVTNTTTLPANYSALDPTFNAGAESAAFGTATWTGTVLPTAGSLAANLDAPATLPTNGLFLLPGRNSFDSRTILAAEGQVFQQLLALTTDGPSEIVFEATGAPAGEDWVVSFGGKTISGTSTVGVAFSTDGSSFVPVGNVNLTTAEQAVSLPLGTNPGTTGFVQLSLDDSMGQPIIDNVAVPEPGFGSLLLAGVGGLSVLFRRRK